MMVYPRLMLTALALGLLGTSAHGSVGFFGTFIEVDADGTTDLYDATPFGFDATNFQGASLGTFAPAGSLTFSAVQAMTFKNGGDNVTSVSINYRVTPDGGTPGSFASSDVPFRSNATFEAINGTTFTGSGDQAWGYPNAISPTSPNFVSGLADGDYDLEIFFKGTTFGSDFFDSNGGSNYTASFTVTSVPEPAVALLAGLGGLVLMGSRSKRADVASD